IFESAKIEPVFGAQPVLLRNKLNLNDENSSLRKKSIATMKECIDQAYSIGAKGISFLSGTYEGQNKQRAFDLLVESTEEICYYAKEKDSMILELEIFDYDIDKKSLIGPAELAVDFAKKIRNKFDNFGLMIDLSHLPLLRQSPAEAIVPIREFITHIHIGNCFMSDKNSPLYGDQHVPFGIPGSENDVEQLAEFLQVLMDTGFFGKQQRPIVSFEVKPLKGQDPDIVIANSKRTLNQAWLLVE
ncbi:MAG: TIM barrel protein, partial [Candidatus Ratteibacteria bacterium]